MNQNFLEYLKESIALHLPHDEKEKEPLLIKSDEKSISDIPRMKADYDEIKKLNRTNRKLKQTRASILKKHNLKIEDGQIKEREPLVDNGQLELFGKKEISNKVNQFTDEVKARLDELEIEINRTTPNYKKNLLMTLKKFFMIGGKMPKRYIYLPVSNQINISEIEKINSNNHLDMLLKIKNGAYADLASDDQELFDYLSENGYTLTKEQYVKNICVNLNGKEVPIDQELTNINMIDIKKKKKAIEKQKDAKIIEKINLDILKRENFKPKFINIIQDVKKNSNILNDSVIILTWIPRLVMAQSTNTIWRSCMSYSFNSSSHGVNIHFVPKGIQQGVFIAWLVNLNDRHIKKPMARTLLKPSSMNENTFFWPSKIYTESGERNLINLFDTAIKKYCFLKQKDILGKLEVIRIQTKSDVYDDADSGQSIINFGAVLDNLKSNKKENFDPSEFIREYLKPRLVAFDFKETDFDFLFNYPPLVDYINNEALEGEMHAYYHFLASKIIDLKKYSYFSEFFKDKEDDLKKDFIFGQLFFENSLNTLFLNNPQGFKYFLNICYEKDYLSKMRNEKDLDSIREDFQKIHEKCSIYPHYGRFIKICYDHFGKDIYMPKSTDDSIRQLFYSDLKANEILPLYRDFGLELQPYRVLLRVLFKNNRDNFYAFYKLANFKDNHLIHSLVHSQLMEIIIITLYTKNYKDFDEILSFIKKEKIIFSDKTYEMLYNGAKFNLPIGLYSLIFEKKTEMINYYQKLLDVGFNLIDFLKQANLDHLFNPPNDVNLTLIYDFFLRNQKNKVFEEEYKKLTYFLLENEKAGQIVFPDVLSGITNGNISYNYLIDFLTFFPKYQKNRKINLRKMSEYIINNKLNKTEIDKLLDLLDQKNLLINEVSSFKTIILSDNPEYYSRYVGGSALLSSLTTSEISVKSLLTHFIVNIANKMKTVEDLKDKTFYQMRDQFINFIKQNHKSFKREKLDLKKTLSQCDPQSLCVMIPIIKKLIDVIEVEGDSLEDVIENKKEAINFSYFFVNAFAMYQSDPKRLEEDLVLIGAPKYTHHLFKILNEQDVLSEIANYDKMYFTKEYFDLIMRYSVSDEEKDKIFETKCIEFATNHHPNGKKSDFYTIDELKLFISFLKKHNKEKLFKDIINKYILREEFTKTMTHEHKIYEINDAESLYRSFIRYLRLPLKNNPILPYIDKEVFLSSILLDNPTLSSLRIDVMSAVIKSEDIKDKKIEEIIKQSLKTKYSDRTKIMIMAELNKVFGKNKIEELKNN